MLEFLLVLSTICIGVVVILSCWFVLFYLFLVNFVKVIYQIFDLN